MEDIGLAAGGSCFCSPIGQDALNPDLYSRIPNINIHLLCIEIHVHPILGTCNILMDFVALLFCQDEMNCVPLTVPGQSSQLLCKGDLSSVAGNEPFFGSHL